MGKYIKTPDYDPTSKLRKTPWKRYTINVLNSDDLCIKYCIILAKFMKELLKSKLPLSDPDTLKPYFHNINDHGVKYPINIKDTKLLEKQNQIRINIFISFVLI